MRMVINSIARELLIAIIANRMAILSGTANNSMTIIKDNKIIDLRVLISKIGIINFNREILILICKEEIITSIKIEGRIISMAIDNQELMILLMMKTKRVMIIGEIIKVRMVGMMEVEIKVNKIKMYLKIMKINFRNQNLMNGIKIRKNKTEFKKVDRNKKFKNPRRMFNILMICGDYFF